MKKRIFSLLLVIALIAGITGCGCSNKKKEEKKEFTLVNTSWSGSINDGVSFDDENITLYQDDSNHNDNYFYGKYKLYIGNDAISYLENDLKEYNITEEDIEKMISNNDKYSKDNFIVIDIRYDYGISHGEKIEMYDSLIPWYGFVIDDGNSLDIINMNAKSELKFTKK